MNISFYKYQGAGNDFIVIDHREAPLKNIDNALVAQLCDRRFGIGGDGLMFLTSHPEYDFEMHYYNADGNVGTMCGNGGRCIVAFAKHLGIIENETNFLAVDGPHYAKITEEGNWVELQMIDVEQIANDEDAFVLNTGSPHYVKEVSGLEALDVYKHGYEIRNNDTYKVNGINVNFVEKKPNHLFVRTFERGVEDETYACGTGVTAVAMAMAKKDNRIGHIETPVKVLGGNLEIKFNYNGQVFSDVFLCGPAEKVFEGKIIV
ncbi:diaminopimelate epimerase [Pedobacter montanisoli]|uniref:Diaminopimelate epimerase n=1 Tax=Pedobacter montanisoli TaxID=2923277 RepID=A0ABS9ZUT2_9SPHI|nr:diaminopimelate epimerase [Pedobacter montanisoli]MCJ0742137.1 diaminopimelate epimerase [Pedobacter montanisoli]